MKNLTKMIIALCAGALVPFLMAPRNGSGTYQLPAGNPVVTGTTISSTAFNNTMTDLGTALTGSLAKDGQTTPTANLPMGTFRHTSVGNPTARNQYGTVDQIQDGDYLTVGSVSGTNTVVGSLSPTISAYVAGMQVVLIPANANTSAVTLNLNSVGALDVQKYDSGGQVALAAGDLRAGIPAVLVLDTGSDDWILTNPYSGVVGNISGAVNVIQSVLGTSTITGTLPGLSAYVPGMMVVLTLAGSSSTPATLNLNSLGALDIEKHAHTVGQSALDASDMRGGEPAFLILDSGGDDWVLLNPYSVFSVASIAAVSATLSSSLTTVGITASGTVTVAALSATTTCTVNSSRCNTIATSGRTALASISGTTVTRGLNVGSVANPGTGQYTLDTTSAGFTAVPVCSGASVGTTAMFFTHNVSGSTSTSQNFRTFNSGGSAAADSFEVICTGP